MDPITIAIADDNEKFRCALGSLLEHEPNLKVIIEASNGEDLLARMRVRLPDVILLDIRMPVMSGLEAAEVIIRDFKLCKIICITELNCFANILGMFSRGVRCFMDKSQLDELPSAIRLVNAGGTCLPESLSTLFQEFVRSQTIDPVECTVTERMMIRAIAQGSSSNEIGELIHRSGRTVEEYRTALYNKFNVRNKEQLIVAAVRQGMI